MDSDDMWTKANVLMRLVSSAVKISEKAGLVIRNVLNEGQMGTVEKTGRNDVQTEADRQAQNCIIGSLKEIFGDELTVIGEEDGECTNVIECAQLELGCCQNVLKQMCPNKLASINLKDIVVWVDPLDGTAEFWEYAQNRTDRELLDHVTVMIGIAVGGHPVAGVVHQPYYRHRVSGLLGRTIWGIEDLGMFGACPAAKPTKRIIVTTRSHQNEQVKRAIEAVAADEVIKVGGAGHKVLMVIEGRASAYLFASAGCKKWDTCAPEAILRAIGGDLTDLHGNHYDYKADVKKMNSAGVLATPKGENHQWYISQIPKELKDSLKP